MAALLVTGFLVYYFIIRKKCGGSGSGTMYYNSAAKKWCGSFTVKTAGPSYTLWNYSTSSDNLNKMPVVVGNAALANGATIQAQTFNGTVSPGDILIVQNLQECVSDQQKTPASFSTLIVDNSNSTCDIISFS